MGRLFECDVPSSSKRPAQITNRDAKIEPTRRGGNYNRATKPVLRTIRATVVHIQLDTKSIVPFQNRPQNRQINLNSTFYFFSFLWPIIRLEFKMADSVFSCSVSFAKKLFIKKTSRSSFGTRRGEIKMRESSR